ncbi:MAG: hypothetical protein VR68_00495 [Peptococcaceae bacterium BRH_c4a]|nr:MAG: hypothetical protein VR68_00495 [Peptococcaceae bacterium BRH_c4a]
MSREMAEMVARELGLKGEAEKLLVRNIRSLERKERKCYFQQIKPQEDKIKELLKMYYSGGAESVRDSVVQVTVKSLLDKKGDPDLVDSLVMDVVGRIIIYKKLRENSESQGIKLNALTNFGGLSMVLFLVVFITAIVLYLKNM